MSLFSILEALLIGPLKLIFEIIFAGAYKFVEHPGISIIFLSLVMNILVLPLYRRADAMQEAARDIDNKLHDGVAHIKKTFSGDERMMILQTYYRQNNYKPTDALRGSVSLLLEIPFFMAAYQFLSHLEILQGVSFGPIRDLSAPDGLIVIGGVVINLLPILMTLINIISSAIYLKGFPAKTKVQLYAMAMFFLVFLYTSPSGLVFYWTLNNLFSFGKNIFYKIKNPQKVLKIITTALGICLAGFGAFFYETDSVKKRIFIIGLGILLLIPIIMPASRKYIKKKEKEAVPNKKIFVLGTVFLTVLVGLLIPTTFIAASPQEYVDVTYFHNPLWYVVSCTCLAAGTFLIWFRVFYWLASDKVKVFFEKLISILCVIMTVNYMFFGTDLGNISSALIYDNEMSFTMREQLINIVVLMVAAVIMYFCIMKWKSTVSMVLSIAILAVGVMSAVHMVTIKNSVDGISKESLDSGGIPNISLSTEGKNVVVIMLDRAMGIYVPYIFNEKPELEKQFEGFTYYSNTISYGSNTNFGAPPLFGGYEYTPVEMNRRNNETLMSKHNEALKVMPVLFAENNYKVTVCDPVYANYQWIPDLSIYSEYPDIDAYITKGKFGDVSHKEAVVKNNYRNFFCFGIMKTMPLFLQPTIYNNGGYNRVSAGEADVAYSTQNADSMSTATGLSASFMESYNVLASMPNITKVTKDESNTYFFLSSDITHEPMLLQEPDYTPAENVDNREYDAAHAERFMLNGKELKMETLVQMSHYHANMATLMQLGNWFDYLRENGVYDNTRIILVSDHGRHTYQTEDLYVNEKDLNLYFPLFMVKDFGSSDFVTSDEFMTNADVPSLAMKDLIDNPVNPFTGKAITSNEKNEHEQYIINSSDWDITLNNGNTFNSAKWISVKDNIWEKDNWTFYDKDTVLKEHKAP